MIKSYIFFLLFLVPQVGLFAQKTKSEAIEILQKHARESSDNKKTQDSLRNIKEDSPVVNLLSCLAEVKAAKMSAATKDSAIKALEFLLKEAFGPDSLTPAQRATLIQEAKDSLDWEYKGKKFGYRLGGNGSDGYIDCSNHVCKVYTEAGLKYAYLNVDGFVASSQKRGTKFIELKPNQAKVGDVIVFLKSEGNSDNHMGVVSRVSKEGDVLAFISACTRNRLATDRESDKFKPSIIEYKPTAFREKSFEGKTTWRIYRWYE